MHACIIKRISTTKIFWLQAKIISFLSKKPNNPARTLCTKFCHLKWKISVLCSIKPNFRNRRPSLYAHTHRPPSHIHTPHPRCTCTNTWKYIPWVHLRITIGYNHTLTLECQINNTANSHTSSWCCVQFVPCCVWIYSNATTGQTNKALNGKLWQLVHV